MANQTKRCLWCLQLQQSIAKPLGARILPSCQKSYTWPPWSHCYPQWLLHPVSVLPQRPPASWPPPHCPHGKRCTCKCTPFWLSSFFVLSASCSCLPSSTPSASTAPLVPGLKTQTQPTHVTWSVRTPPIGAVPLITSQWGMWSDWNIGPGRLIFVYQCICVGITLFLFKWQVCVTAPIFYGLTPILIWYWFVPVFDVLSNRCRCFEHYTITKKYSYGAF